MIRLTTRTALAVTACVAVVLTAFITIIDPLVVVMFDGRREVTVTLKDAENLGIVKDLLYSPHGSISDATAVIDHPDLKNFCKDFVEVRVTGNVELREARLMVPFSGQRNAFTGRIRKYSAMTYIVIVLVDQQDRVMADVLTVPLNQARDGLVSKVEYDVNNLKLIP